MAKRYKKRADGRYAVQIKIGVFENGKTKYKTLYARTQEDLEKKERDFRSYLDKGIIIDDEDMTVEDWAKKWMKTYKSNLSFKSVEMYNTMINRHIIPSIGSIKLSKLKPYHVQNMTNEKAADGLTDTLRKRKLTLNQMIKQAIINEYIYKDIMLGIELPTIRSNTKRALTRDEQGFIVSSKLPKKERAYLLTLLYTGMRRGEALALNVGDVNFDENHITVNKSVSFKNNRPLMKDCPKTEAGFRSIVMPSFLSDILSEYISANNTFLLFPDANGDLFTYHHYNTFFSGAIKEIERQTNKKNLRVFNIGNDITTHTFRHTYAALLFEAGIDVKTAQYLLGHSSIQVTMDIYAFVK